MERRALTFVKLGILFLFLDFHVGRVNLLPTFVGMLFLNAAIASHDVQTETEKRLKPLLLALAADHFLHWIFSFENSLESLLSSVISVYVLFMFMGEVIKRIRENQRGRALQLNFARMGTVILLTMNFLLAAYDNSMVNGVLVTFSLMMMLFLMVTVCQIRPEGGDLFCS